MDRATKTEFTRIQNQFPACSIILLKAGPTLALPDPLERVHEVHTFFESAVLAPIGEKSLGKGVTVSGPVLRLCIPL